MPHQCEENKNINTSKKTIQKPLNPTKDTDERIFCPSCGSFRQLLKECSNSYEILKKSELALKQAVEQVAKLEES